MTGATYTKEILPHYITAIHNLQTRAKLRDELHKFKLQEDNNRLYRHSEDDYTIQDRIKSNVGIETIEHPAKSPDCNPQEAV